MDYHQLLAYAEREEAREAKRTRAATDADTAVTTQEGRWRAGVNRQAQPDAAAHQQQQAARGGVARQALPDAHAQRLTALARATPAASAARSKKRKERQEQEQLDALAYAASDDEDDHDEQQEAHEAAVDAWLQDSAAQDAAWEAERPRRERERERAEREKQDDSAHASESIWVQDSESGTWSLYTRGKIAGERDCGFFCAFQPYTGDLAAAAAYFREPHSDASEAWLEAQLTQGGGGPPPPGPPCGDDCYYDACAENHDNGSRGEWLASLPPGEREHYELMTPRPICDATGRVVLMEALDPEGYFPYYYFPGDVGHAIAKSYGDRESFYAWLEASGQECAAASASTATAAPQIPDPPKRGDFPRGRGAVGKAGREAFHRERKKWFKLATRSSEHPDGIELDGTLAEQNTRYDIVARRFRAYSDGRSASALPKEKTWEEQQFAAYSGQGSVGADAFY